MKFEINRSAFQKAIAALSKVVEKRNTIPILANVAIEAKGGELRLSESQKGARDELAKYEEQQRTELKFMVPSMTLGEGVPTPSTERSRRCSSLGLSPGRRGTFYGA